MRDAEIQTGDPGGVKKRPRISVDHSLSEDLEYPQLRPDLPLTYGSRNLLGLFSFAFGASALVLALGGCVAVMGTVRWVYVAYYACPLLCWVGGAFGLVAIVLATTALRRRLDHPGGGGVFWAIGGLVCGGLGILAMFAMVIASMQQVAFTPC